MHWRRKWQPAPVFLPGESQGRGSLVGCRLWGRTELDTTEVTYQQQRIQRRYRDHSKIEQLVRGLVSAHRIRFLRNILSQRFLLKKKL